MGLLIRVLKLENKKLNKFKYTIAKNNMKYKKKVRYNQIEFFVFKYDLIKVIRSIIAITATNDKNKYKKSITLYSYILHIIYYVNEFVYSFPLFIHL
jgi:hypothetical protein